MCCLSNLGINCNILNSDIDAARTLEIFTVINATSKPIWKLKYPILILQPFLIVTRAQINNRKEFVVGNSFGKR